MSGGTTPKGWYPDPNNASQERWWDGVAWTEATRQRDTGGTPPLPPPPAPPPPGSGTPYAPPGYGVAGGPLGPPPPTYLVWAILTTLMCCLPFGIVSIVKAASVESKWHRGDIAGARAASESAKNWAIAAAVIGGVLALVYFALVMSALDDG